MSKPEFVYRLVIASTLEKVWQALTDGEFTRQYWAARRIESEWKPGSPVRMTRKNGEHDWDGTVLEAVPPTRLVYTFCCPPDPGDAEEPPSRVTFDLKQTDAGVELVVVHDQFEEGSNILKSISSGWPVILTNMKRLLETGAAERNEAWE